ncbi:MAG TPA: HIRAN domain-containing protein [Rhodocyclaceae bacterium]|nr:HIRAN domain-containing protein [Rhodocyclaceae bacterium]
MRSRWADRVRAGAVALTVSLPMLLSPSAGLGQPVLVWVQSSPLAGFQYYAGEALWDTFAVGDRVELDRDPDNRHDGRAIRVRYRGQMIGFLPRAENDAVAAAMDRGAPLEGRIGALARHRDPWQRVRIEIWMRVR